MSDTSLTLDKSTLIIRRMASEDLAKVLTIERHVHISPWSRLSFEESLTMQEPLANQESLTMQESSANQEPSENEKYICRVVESKDDIIGYFIVCPIADELHILNVAIDSQYQGLGIGHLLMEGVIRLAMESKKTKIFLEVRASNEVAQGLYLKWQFEHIAIRKRYYSIPNSSNTNDREDAYIFMRHLRTQA